MFRCALPSHLACEEIDKVAQDRNGVILMIFTHALVGLCASFIGVWLYMPETLQPPPPPLRTSLSRLLCCCTNDDSGKQYTELAMDAEEDDGFENQTGHAVEQRNKAGGSAPNAAVSAVREKPAPCLTKLGCNLLMQRKVFLVIISSTNCDRRNGQPRGVCPMGHRRAA